jgi:replicative DNA helicase
MSPGQIHAECKILTDKRGNPIRPDIIIIDYIQRMYRVEFKGTRREELMTISQQLTRIGDASHFDCPVVVGAQIRKSALGKEPPTMFDIQECGDIAQDADVAVIVWQKSLVDDATEFPNQFDIIVDKNKQTGARGAISCYFDKAIARIVDGVTHDINLGERPEHYSDK